MTIEYVAADEVRVGLRGVSMIFLAGTKANAIGGCARRFGAAVVLSGTSIVAVGASKAADWPDMTAPLRGTYQPTDALGRCRLRRAARRVEHEH